MPIPLENARRVLRSDLNLEFIFDLIEGSLSPRQTSDGTMRGLAVLVALFQGLVETPVYLVGLEEPETALHPAAAGVLFDAMREASQNVPVIATTHSADLLDKKEFDPDAILAKAEIESDPFGTIRNGIKPLPDLQPESVHGCKEWLEQEVF